MLSSRARDPHVEIAPNQAQSRVAELTEELQRANAKSEFLEHTVSDAEVKHSAEHRRLVDKLTSVRRSAVLNMRHNL